MGRVKRREVLGIRLECRDGAVWTWTIDGQTYRWCALGFCERISGDHVRRLMFSRTVDGAVGYTCGLHDGLGYAQRGNVASTPESSEG